MKRRHPTTKLLEGKLRNAAGFLSYVLDRFNRDYGLSMASALAYTSLLSVVPVLAMGLAMLAAFPVFDDARMRLQSWVILNMVPSVGVQVQEWVAHAVENAGRLTAVGVVGLSFTAVMLLLTIESSINLIFRVDRQRRLSARLFVYWTIMTLGPLLLGASVSLAGSLDTFGRWAERYGLGYLEPGAAALPTVLATLAFAITYFAVPNRPVRMRDALTGGLAAGLLFTALRWGFGVYIGSSQTYRTLYGALAAVPIFLAWTYFSWAVVLIGAEITAALPEWRHGRLDRPGLLPASRRLSLAVDVLHCLFRDSLEGSRGITRKDLLAITVAAGEDLRWVLHLLHQSRFVARLDDGRYFLSRDCAATTLYDLVLALDLRLAPEPGEVPRSDWQEALRQRLERSDEAEHTWLGVSLRTLFADEPRPAVESPRPFVEKRPRAGR